MSPTSLRAALPGLFFAVVTLLFGFGFGIVFGYNEAAIKGRLNTSATAVQETVYKGDLDAAKPVIDKSWNYMQRAHLHAGGLGTGAIALSLLLVAVGTSPVVTRVLSLALGLGALGYSMYWLLAGFRAPGLGSTGAAKESLAWLAMPSSGAMVLATAVVAGLLLAALTGRRTAA